MNGYQIISEGLKEEYNILYHQTSKNNENSIQKNGLKIDFHASTSGYGFWKTPTKGIYLSSFKIPKRPAPYDKMINITIKVDPLKLLIDESDIRWKMIDIICKKIQPEEYQKLNKRKFKYPQLSFSNCLFVYNKPFQVFDIVIKDFLWLYKNEDYLIDIIRYNMLAELYTHYKKDSKKIFPADWIKKYRQLYSEAAKLSNKEIKRSYIKLYKDGVSFISLEDIGFEKRIPKIIKIENV